MVLDVLSSVGVDVYFYEVWGCFGGRVFIVNSVFELGLNIEDGGNLINSDYVDMLVLVKCFGILLIDCQLMCVYSCYVVDGWVIGEVSLVCDLCLIVVQIGKDVVVFDVDYESIVLRFDVMLVVVYFDEYVRLIKLYICVFLEVMICIEFGVELDQVLVIELLFNLLVVDGK